MDTDDFSRKHYRVQKRGTVFKGLQLLTCRFVNVRLYSFLEECKNEGGKEFEVCLCT